MPFNAEVAKQYVSRTLSFVKLPLSGANPGQYDGEQLFQDSSFAKALGVSHEGNNLAVSFNETLTNKEIDAIGSALHSDATAVSPGKRVTYTHSEKDDATKIELSFPDAATLDAYADHMKQTVDRLSGVRSGRSAQQER